MYASQRESTTSALWRMHLRPISPTYLHHDIKALEEVRLTPPGDIIDWCHRCRHGGSRVGDVTSGTLMGVSFYLLTLTPT